jgi:hypothetical protein
MFNVRTNRLAGGLMIAAVLVALATTVAFAASTSVKARPPSNPAPAPAAATFSSQSLAAADVIAARQATAKYATNLTLAKADGYKIITRMIPYMGYHFLNAKVTGFNVRRPAILVYEHNGNKWQLGALEWVFTSMPAKPPLPGATYGVFGAACHYTDGTFVFQTVQSKCATKSPQTGAKFSFWHPRLITMHFWVWYPNPSGLYTGTNPLAAPFNRG